MTQFTSLNIRIKTKTKTLLCKEINEEGNKFRLHFLYELGHYCQKLFSWNLNLNLNEIWQVIKDDWVLWDLVKLLNWKENKRLKIDPRPKYRPLKWIVSKDGLTQKFQGGLGERSFNPIWLGQGAGQLNWKERKRPKIDPRPEYCPLKWIVSTDKLTRNFKEVWVKEVSTRFDWVKVQVNLIEKKEKGPKLTQDPSIAL